MKSIPHQGGSEGSCTRLTPSNRSSLSDSLLRHYHKLAANAMNAGCNFILHNCEFSDRLLSGHRSETSRKDIYPTRVPSRRLESHHGTPPKHRVADHIRHDDRN